MKVFKEVKWEALLKGIFYIVLGVTALLISEQMVKGLGYLMGIVLILAGAVSMIGYLLRDARQNYYHDEFAYGLLCIVLGCLVLYKVELIISMVPFLLGLLVLISGITKLQDVIDMKRLECGNWIGMLIVAILNLLLGVVLILNPFDAALVLFKMLGIGLILSGITDTLVSIYFAGKMAAYKKSEAVAAEADRTGEKGNNPEEWSRQEKAQEGQSSEPQQGSKEQAEGGSAE